MTIGVIGLWHLGEIFSVCLSDLGIKVIGVDENGSVIDGLNRGHPPIVEPKLDQLLRKNLANSRLHYTSDFRSLRKCSVLWLTFDTPVDGRDRADATVIIQALAKSLPYLRNNVLVIVSSQLPVGTSQQIINFIKKTRPRLKFEYAYVPENLRLGEAVDSFFQPGRIVIGADQATTQKKVIAILKNLKTNFLTMNLISAEMVKHALNAFLATSLSFIYDIADTCEAVGGDIVAVSEALKTDPRIGSRAYLDASLGFSGGTLARDLQYLLEAARKRHLSTPVIKAALVKNKHRSDLLFRKLVHHLATLENKKIALFGLTYKAGTPTLRRSLALDLARRLNRLGVRLSLCDPLVQTTEVNTVLKNIHPEFSADPYTAVKDCQAVIFVTPWEQLKDLNFEKLRRQMKRPTVFFDARNYFYQTESKLKQLGFTYIGVGR
ncbi:MAG: nucleotide sugar dehydrogenase [Microgenomates group bacterium]